MFGLKSNKKPVVLIVDDEAINISILAFLLKNDYELRVARDGFSALNIASREPTLDLILLDVIMPSINGLDVCQKLKAFPQTADIPVIFITAAGHQSECMGFQNGAVDYIYKPFNAPGVLLRIDSHIKIARYRKQLQHNYEFLNALLAKTPIAIAIIAPGGRFLFANQKALSITGFSSVENLEYIKQIDLDSKYVKQATRALSKAFRGNEQQLTVQLLGNDNRLSSLDVRFLPQRDECNTINSVLLIGIDVTERQQMEERLHLMGKVFENALEGIVISDMDGRVVDFNPAYSAITGYSKTEIRSSKYGFPQLKEYGAEFERALQHAMQNGGQWQGEIFNRRKNGELLTEWLSINTIKNSLGQPEFYLGVYNDITQLKLREEQLSLISHYDLLTGLPNRMLILDLMKHTVADCRRGGGLSAVCYLDLDGFKQLNDLYGVDFCNAVLVECAKRLEITSRDIDTVARVGGDEFVILLTRLHSALECTQILERILLVLGREITISGVSCRLSCSIGVTLLPYDCGDPDMLLRHADQAMYVAKSSGKNRFHFFDPEEDRRIREISEKLQRIQQALDNDEFVMFFQPKLNLRNNILVGAEALIRWRHPELGILQPSEFLPMIDGTELEIKLGEMVILKALQQQERWLAGGLRTELSINISPNHLQKPGFVNYLREQLVRYSHIPPELIQIEILETAALENIELALSTMRSCIDLGVQFALDDFGTGYSSLTNICKLPVNTIKIDQTFIRAMLEDDASMRVVAAVIGLANNFARHIVAEGIETSLHLQKLIELGCHIGQGYSIAKPMCAEDFWEWQYALYAMPPDTAGSELTGLH